MQPVYLREEVEMSMNRCIHAYPLVTRSGGMRMCMYCMLYETLHTCGYLRTTGAMPPCVLNTIDLPIPLVTRSG